MYGLSIKMKPKLVTVHDSIQKKYRYSLTEPVGKNFDAEFKPQLTPQEMLELGVFGGFYLYDCQDEFPKSWFKKAKMVSGSTPDPKLNFFGIRASQPLSVWLEKGWIYPEDPRADGFSGIAGITWGDGFRRKTRDKFDDGKRFVVISRKS
jgi:hypothetical protein